MTTCSTASDYITGIGWVKWPPPSVGFFDSEVTGWPSPALRPAEYVRRHTYSRGVFHTTNDDGRGKGSRLGKQATKAIEGHRRAGSLSAGQGTAR